MAAANGEIMTLMIRKAITNDFVFDIIPRDILFFRFGKAW